MTEDVAAFQRCIGVLAGFDMFDVASQTLADGGILGKKIEPVEEDGQSEPTVFAEKINKLLTEDKVSAVFGGWTSASRKAMLPVVEGAKGLLFYPVQYEGLEASKNIYYTGATTNQQIIPAMDFLESKGVKTLFLAGSDYVFPRTANKIIKQYAKELGIEIVGEEYVPLDSDDWTWGHLHRLDLHDPTLGESGIGPVEWLVNRDGWEVDGGSSAVDAAAWDAADGYDVVSAPSMRMVVSLADWDDSRWINLTGVSGHPFDDHYTDQTDLYVRGETLPWAFTSDAVERAGDDVLTLEPTPADG